MMADFVATARYVKGRPDSTGRLGVTGFCFGGGVANNLAVQLGPDLHASVRIAEHFARRRHRPAPCKPRPGGATRRRPRRGMKRGVSAA